MGEVVWFHICVLTSIILIPQARRVPFQYLIILDVDFPSFTEIKIEAIEVKWLV